MAKALDALDFLSQRQSRPVPPVCAVFGGESFLKRQCVLRLRELVLGGQDAEFSLATFEGNTAEFRDVLGELSTRAMFGQGKRLVIVAQADEFVSRHRPALEDYVAKPSPSGVLVLVLDTLASNTRLYKGIVSEGLAIQCAAPAQARLVKWLAAWALQTHALRMTASAAEVLLEIIGPELGLLDQELAKLALMAGPDHKIDEQTVNQAVGGWRTRTTWEMLDAAMAGDVAGALTQLDRLLLSGETPVGVLGQISASLRRLASATRVVLQAEAAGRRVSLRSALEQSGVRTFVLQKVERELRRLGRHRGARVYSWLREADLDLKGASALPPRLILERLIVRLAVPEGLESKTGSEQ